MENSNTTPVKNQNLGQNSVKIGQSDAKFELNPTQNNAMRYAAFNWNQKNTILEKPKSATIVNHAKISTERPHNVFHFVVRECKDPKQLTRIS